VAKVHAGLRLVTNFPPHKLAQALILSLDAASKTVGMRTTPASERQLR
jgi:hypothetical protein